MLVRKKQCFCQIYLGYGTLTDKNQCVVKKKKKKVYVEEP